VSLAFHAAGYPVTASDEAANVVVSDRLAYVSRAEAGLEVLLLDTGEIVTILPPPGGSGSVDDLALADGLLFALDARPPGHLSVLSITDGAEPALRSGPIEVPVGPFSGVSAGSGYVAVSGGTSALTLRSYRLDGALGNEVVEADFGRGQPDILVNANQGFVSTHFSGPNFGLTTFRVTPDPLAVIQAGTMSLETIGFTAGGAKPANFPIESALSRDVLLIAYERGLALIDVSQLDRPRLLSELPLEMKPVNVDVDGKLAAVVGSAPKPLLCLVDITEPMAPRVLRSVSLPEGSYATGVAIGSTHIVVAAHSKGALLFPR
jgi:hypothetical protein